jgi:hypothetical protein
MLYRLKVQAHTWYLRYYFFSDPLKYQAITKISKLLFRNSPADDRAACREVLYLLNQGASLEILQVLLTSLLNLLAQNAEEHCISRYHGSADLSLEEHQRQRAALNRSLMQQTDSCASLHTELVSLYKATQRAHILDLLQVIYQRASWKEFWEFWDEAMDVRPANGYYQFASEPALSLMRSADHLEYLIARYPIQKCLVDALMRRSELNLQQSEPHIARFYRLVEIIDKNQHQNQQWALYAQLCACLNTLGLSSVPPIELSPLFSCIKLAIERYQANVRTGSLAEQASGNTEDRPVVVRFGIQ